MRRWMLPFVSLVLLVGVSGGRPAAFDSKPVLLTAEFFTVRNSLMLQLDVVRPEREFELLADFGGCPFRLLVGPGRRLPSAHFPSAVPLRLFGPAIIVNFHANSFRFTAERMAAESFRCVPTITKTPDGFRLEVRVRGDELPAGFGVCAVNAAGCPVRVAWSWWKVVLLLVLLAASVGSTVWCVWWVYRLFKGLPMV
ncbi:hypothetical protein M3Y99_01432300 [Aphelenchoides fujianensis]|nr:hypothetical protein M3Y99_01432300 [Aphelenchoides fujianensis]